MPYQRITLPCKWCYFKVTMKVKGHQNGFFCHFSILLYNWLSITHKYGHVRPFNHCSFSISWLPCPANGVIPRSLWSSKVTKMAKNVYFGAKMYKFHTFCKNCVQKMLIMCSLAFLKGVPSHENSLYDKKKRPMSQSHYISLDLGAIPLYHVILATVLFWVILLRLKKKNG